MAMSKKASSLVGSAADVRSGITLIETVLSILIISVLLTVALNLLGGVAKARATQNRSQEVQSLGWDLLTEVLQAYYEDPDIPDGWGPEPGEASDTRSDFDDIDDYDNWTASPPQAKDGTPIAGWEQWKRGVTVTRVDPQFIFSPMSTDLGLRRVEVAVEDPNGNVTTYYALQAKGGLRPAGAGDEVTYVTWTGIRLQTAGQGGNPTEWGVHLVNRPAVE